MASDLYGYIFLFSLVFKNKFWKPSPAHFLSFLPLFIRTEDPTGSYAIKFLCVDLSRDTGH